MYFGQTIADERPTLNAVILSPLCAMASGNDQDGRPDDDSDARAADDQEDLNRGEAIVG